MFVFVFLKQGGFFMYILLGVSIVALAIILWKVKELYLRLSINADHFLRLITKTVEAGNIGQAIEVCNRKRRNPLARVLKAGLLKANRSDKEIQHALEEEVLRTTPRISKGTNYLAMLGNISTLLGLLGTIFGLIKAFKSVGLADQALKQELLAKGISIAMFTTAGGLVVAIPCIIAYQILHNRQSRMIERIEESAVSLFNHLSSLNKSGGSGRRAA